MKYQTSTGVTLDIVGLPRQSLDDFAASHPVPLPPVRPVVVFGSIEENVPDPTDPIYQAQMLAYRLQIAHEQLELLLPAISIVSDWRSDSRFLEMAELGLVTPDSVLDFLRFVALSDVDADEVVGMILYQSTVTEQGIAEAAHLFGVTWAGQNVMALSVKDSPGRYNEAFEHRDAARFAGMAWADFCRLSGKAQSAIVAHYRLRTRLDYLMSQEARK